MPPGEAMAIIDGGSADPEGENRMAISCYARAMDHVVALAGDPAGLVEQRGKGRSTRYHPTRKLTAEVA